MLNDKNQAFVKSPTSNAFTQKSTRGFPATPNSSKQEKENLTNKNSSNSVLKIGGYGFQYVCTIEPMREPNEAVRIFMPQAKYLNIDNLPLNRYGKGPFCKFVIPRNIEFPGVYALIEANDVKYIGECIALSARFNMGYGNISPRNCFVGGQETNCRINNLILKRVLEGSTITLWFHNTHNHKSIEVKLRVLLPLSWNLV